MTSTATTSATCPAALEGTAGPYRSAPADLARVAAASCGAPYGAVSTREAAGAWSHTAEGFDDLPAGAAELCERVATEGRVVVIGDHRAGERPGAIRMFAGAPVLDPQNHLLGVLWVADDRSRDDLAPHLGELLAVLAENAAMRSELAEPRVQQYEYLHEMLRSVAFRSDTDGVLEWVSPSWLTLTGRSADTAVGRPLTELIKITRRDLDDAILPDVTSTVMHRAQGNLETSEGHLLPVQVLMKRSTAQGTSESCIIGVAADIKEQQQHELEMRHDQKLESLGRLSAGIAHEINTPIQFVGDNTRFLASACEEMLELLLVYRACMDASSGQKPWEERNARVRAAEDKADIDYLATEVPVAVQQSLEGIDRVAGLVRAMKSFSYKDANDRSYSDLNEALRTTLTVARNEVKYVADVNLDLGDVPEVLCYIGDLNQVFLNLLVNAADAIREQSDQGEARERGEIRISTRTDGAEAVVSFADTGGGVPESIRQVIFEPFFTTKEVGKGTGQGLALARAVVQDKHGGTIEVNDVAPHGTEFVLRLPIAGKARG